MRCAIRNSAVLHETHRPKSIGRKVARTAILPVNSRYDDILPSRPHVGTGKGMPDVSTLFADIKKLERHDPDQFPASFDASPETVRAATRLANIAIGPLGCLGGFWPVC